jgi:hypothetical protein
VLDDPFHQWTRKISGKTVTRLLSDDQLADYQERFDNQRRLCGLLAKVEALSRAITEADLPVAALTNCWARPA